MWSDGKFCMILDLLNLFRFVLWPRKWSILVNVFCWKQCVFCWWWVERPVYVSQVSLVDSAVQTSYMFYISIYLFYGFCFYLFYQLLRGLFYHPEQKSIHRNISFQYFLNINIILTWGHMIILFCNLHFLLIPHEYFIW